MTTATTTALPDTDDCCPVCGEHFSDPHGPGCREHLTLLEGCLEVTSGDESQCLNKGDTARYFADRPHRLEAQGGPARAILIVQNS